MAILLFEFKFKTQSCSTQTNMLTKHRMHPNLYGSNECLKLEVEKKTRIFILQHLRVTKYCCSQRSKRRLGISLWFHPTEMFVNFYLIHFSHHKLLYTLKRIKEYFSLIWQKKYSLDKICSVWSLNRLFSILF